MTVTNSVGSVTSAPATLTVAPPVRPVDHDAAGRPDGAGSGDRDLLGRGHGYRSADVPVVQRGDGRHDVHPDRGCDVDLLHHARDNPAQNGTQYEVTVTNAGLGDLAARDADGRPVAASVDHDAADRCDGDGSGDRDVLGHGHRYGAAGVSVVQ